MTGVHGIGRRRKVALDSALRTMEPPPEDSTTRTQMIVAVPAGLDPLPAAGEPVAPQRPDDGEASLRLVSLWLCEPCLAGAGGECHSPGCALWMNRAPNVPVNVNGDAGLPSAGLSILPGVAAELGMGYLFDSSLPVPAREVPEGTPDAGPAPVEAADGAAPPGVPPAPEGAGPAQDESSEDEAAAKECAE